jgi:hypothetical protein
MRQSGAALRAARRLQRLWVRRALREAPRIVLFEPSPVPSPPRSGAPRRPIAAAPGRHRGLSAVTRALRWLHDLYLCMDRTRTFGLAAETAFWLFLSLIPLAAVAGLAAARISNDHWDRLNPLLTSLPPATRELITSE